MPNSIANDYYLKQRNQLEKRFTGFLVAVKTIMQKQYDNEFVNQALKNMHEEFSNLIPQIPYIGGDENKELTEALISSVQFLPIYKVLKKSGIATPVIGKIAIDSFQLQIDKIPFWRKWQMRFTWRLMFTKFVKNKMSEAAEKSLNRKYPANFVYNFVKGDNKNFAFGWDFLECAVCKFFHAQNADEFTPYVCQTDFIIAKMTKVNLTRTQTLAESGCKCDFRYKK